MLRILVAMILGLTCLSVMAQESEILVKEIPTTKEIIKVATVQVPLEFDAEKMDAADLVTPWIERAGQDGVDLVVFPEYILGIFDLPGELTLKVGNAARAAKVNVVVGGWEKLPGYEPVWPPKPKTYANTALIFNRDGEIVGKYRKLYAACGDSPYCWPPKPDELGEWAMVWGEEMPVFDLDFGRIGVLTCYDGYFSPVWETLSLKGAEVIVWINGRPGIEDYIVNSMSFMQCVAVVTCNNAKGQGAMICDYPARILALADKPGETYLTAPLNLLELRKQRRNNRMFHQRRPELYKEMLQEQKPWEAYPYIPAHKYE